MNFIPKYIFFTKLLIVLNDYYNRLLFLVPVCFIRPKRYKNIVNNISKEELAQRLKSTLGDFNYFLQQCGKHPDIEVIIHDANNTLNHHFEVLGSGLITSDPIDWHCDFKSGFKWPYGKYYKKYIRVNKGDNSDVKVPIELSRCHHLLWLGEAYLITHDDKYSSEVVNEICDWINENPYAYSINWSCTMDVAIRAVNWMYALNMIMDSKIVDDKFCKQVTRSLLEHVYFIFHNLEKGAPYSGNHYASNLSGLIFLGLLFKDIPSIRKYFDFGLFELYREIRNEVLPTGVHYEKSISYHRLMVELFAYPVFLLQKTGFDVPLDICYRVKSMFNFVHSYTKPDGTAPMIGDNDDGRLLPFVKYAFNYHAYLRSVAYCKYKDRVYESLPSIDSFFLFPEICFLTSDSSVKLLPIKTKLFLDAGFAVLRNEEFYVFFNGSGIGMYYAELKKSVIATHNHADLLSFDLSLGECNVFVDAGSYVYTSSLQAHNEFRSTKKHNTVNIDNLDQYHIEQDKFWAYSNFKMPSVLEYSNMLQCQKISGEYCWFFPEDTVRHKRTIEVYGDRMFVIDEFKCVNEHLFQACFMLDPGIRVESVNHDVIELFHPELGRRLRLMVGDIDHVDIRIEVDRVSFSYGCLNETSKIIMEFRQKGTFRYSLKIVPINE